MQRFLSDWQDEHLLHKHVTSQDSFCKGGIQTVMDRIDELGLSRKEAKDQ
jgi:hypothetical protein